jgi:hypothetical protein
MKNTMILVMAAMALTATAQETTQTPVHTGRIPPHQSALAAALDTNKDGVIDAAELANASAALKALDKNGDGQIEMTEIQPALKHSTDRPLAPAHARHPAHLSASGDAGSVEVPPHASPEAAPVPPHAPVPPPAPALMAALDANKDGVIDATELANASAALKALDKNGDGQLTTDEYQPQRRVKGGKAMRHAGIGSGQPRHRPAAEQDAPPVHEP